MREDTGAKRVNTLIDEYFEFFELKSKLPALELSPSQIIDHVWQAHITCTASYFAFCDGHFEFVRHDPTVFPVVRYHQTLDAYGSHFGRTISLLLAGSATSAASPAPPPETKLVAGTKGTKAQMSGAGDGEGRASAPEAKSRRTRAAVKGRRARQQQGRVSPPCRRPRFSPSRGLQPHCKAKAVPKRAPIKAKRSAPAASTGPVYGGHRKRIW